MKKHFSFRQKLGGAFAVLLTFIVIQGLVSWLALTEINALFSEVRDVERIIEATLDARLNEKTYLKTGERRFAVRVQEELQQAEALTQAMQKRVSLEKSVLERMSGALDRYMSTFSQYVIYHDQSMALKSESARIGTELVEAVDEMRQLSWAGRETDINKLYSLLLISEEGKMGDTERSIAAGKEIIALTEIIRQRAVDADAKIAAARVALLVKDYLGIWEKSKDLRVRQVSNEQKMEAAAEEMLACGKLITESQNEKARERQGLTNFVTVVVFLFSLFMAVGGIFYLMSRLLKPLNELATITEALGQGCFKERVGVETEDEFKELMHSVNRMAENIEDLNANMEELVAERTRALELEKARFEKFFENSPEGILIFNGAMQVLNINPAFSEMFGYSWDEIKGLVSPHFLNSELDDLKEQLKLIGEGVSFREDAVRRSKSGEVKAVSIVKFAFRQYGGELIYCAIYGDISERKAHEEKLKFLSFYDSLTGLKNRTYFELEMGKLQQNGMPCGIIVCDVDGLKQVNDTLGHSAGDRLLQSVAKILEQAAGSEQPARLGGDEFVILLPGANEADIRKIIELIKCGQDKAQAEYAISVSVGYAWRTDQAFSMAELFARADAMMYDEKRRRNKTKMEKLSETLNAADKT